MFKERRKNPDIHCKIKICDFADKYLLSKRLYFSYKIELCTAFCGIDIVTFQVRQSDDEINENKDKNSCQE